MEYLQNFGEAFITDFFDNAPSRLLKVGEATIDSTVGFAKEITYQATDIAVLTYELTTGEATGYQLKSSLAHQSAERLAAGESVGDIILDSAKEQGLNALTAGLYGTGKEYYQTYSEYQAGNLSIEQVEERLATSAGNLVMGAGLAALGGRAGARSRARAPGRSPRPARAPQASTVIESMTQAPGKARAGMAAARRQAAARRGGRAGGAADDVGRAIPCRCFTGDTAVATAAGAREIASVAVGDEVWARNLETGEPQLAKVTQLFSRVAKEIVVLTLAAATIQATPEHPFWVPGEGWVPAEKLEVGDQISSLDGTTRDVEKIEHKTGEWSVYNFEVQGPHNFFVSGDRVLVHNNPCNIGARGRKQTRRASAPIRRAAPYEQRVADLYGGRKAFGARQFEATVGGKRVSGVADNVTRIDGASVAVEAKYVGRWETSIRNPRSPIARGKAFRGSRAVAKAERATMLEQAKKLSAAFDRVVYHSNSPELLAYYSRLFARFGLRDIDFVLTK